MRFTIGGTVESGSTMASVCAPSLGKEAIGHSSAEADFSAAVSGRSSARGSSVGGTRPLISERFAGGRLFGGDITLFFAPTCVVWCLVFVDKFSKVILLYNYVC